MVDIVQNVETWYVVDVKDEEPFMHFISLGGRLEKCPSLTQKALCILGQNAENWYMVVVADGEGLNGGYMSRIRYRDSQLH